MEEQTTGFWEKVDKCKHENHTDYSVDFDCGNSEFCNGSEYRCADCKVYIFECICGNGGMSGWSSRRWKTYNLRKRNEKTQ